MLVTSFYGVVTRAVHNTRSLTNNLYNNVPYIISAPLCLSSERYGQMNFPTTPLLSVFGPSSLVPDSYFSFGKKKISRYKKGEMVGPRSQFYAVE